MRPPLILHYCPSRMAWLLSCGKSLVASYATREQGKAGLKEFAARF